MQADGTINVVIPLGRIEKKLDAAGWLLPLVSDDRLHHVSFRLFIACEDGRGTIPGLKPFTGTIEELLIGDKVPFGMLILQLDLNKGLFITEIQNRSFQ